MRALVQLLASSCDDLYDSLLRSKATGGSVFPGLMGLISKYSVGSSSFIEELDWLVVVNLIGAYSSNVSFGCWKIEIPVQCIVDFAVVEDKLWSILSIAAVVNTLL